MTTNNSHIYLDIKSYSQLSIDDIGAATYNIVESDPFRYTHVILMAGIFDIAQPVRGTPYIDYFHHDPVSCASDITAKVQFWIYKLEQVAPRMKVINASTFGADIDMYNTCSLTEQPLPQITRQSELDKSVAILNGHFTVLNGAYGLPNLHLNHAVHTNRSGRRKTSNSKVSNKYRRLDDGLHPEVELYEELARRIYAFMEDLL